MLVFSCSLALLLRAERAVFSCSLRITDKYGKEKLPLVKIHLHSKIYRCSRDFFVRYANIWPLFFGFVKVCRERWGGGGKGNGAAGGSADPTTARPRPSQPYISPQAGRFGVHSPWTTPSHLSLHLLKLSIHLLKLSTHRLTPWDRSIRRPSRGTPAGYIPLAACVSKGTKRRGASSLQNTVEKTCPVDTRHLGTHDHLTQEHHQASIVGVTA